MTKAQSNKLSMFEAVAAVLNNSGQILSGFPIIVTIKTELIALIEKIKNADKTIETASSGKTDAKEEARKKLSALLLTLANSLYVYAKRKSLLDLQAICYVTKSGLKKMKENEFVTEAGTIIDKLNEQKANLADYSVTDEKITELANAYSLFQQSADTKDTGEAKRIAAHEAVEDLFEDTMDLLEDELDGLMENIKTTNAEFCNEYYAARIIKGLGGQKTNNNTSQEQSASDNQTAAAGTN
jgi:hypothetical protein